MAFGRKKDPDPLSNGKGGCRLCQGNGGHWAKGRNGYRAVNCVVCNRPPKGNPPG